MQTNIRKGHLWQNNSNRFQNLNAFCVHQYLTFLMWSAVNETLFLRGEKIEKAHEVYIKYLCMNPVQVNVAADESVIRVSILSRFVYVTT